MNCLPFRVFFANPINFIYVRAVKHKPKGNQIGYGNEINSIV